MENASPTEIKHLLCDLAKERRKNLNSPPLLAVFDLDSTLFEVSPRSQTILREFALHPESQRRYPEEVAKVAELHTHPEDWGIRPSLERSQIRSTLDFFESIRSFWVERFFANDYLHLDHLYEGALEFVQELHQAGTVIKYLTGRDHERMGKGTLETLKSWNFPIGEPHHSHLILKPHHSHDDAMYKAEKLKDLTKKFEEIWFFENEPTIIAEVKAQLPQVKIVFVDTIHSGKTSPPEGVPRIKARYK